MARTGGLPRGYRPGDPLVLFRRIPGTRIYYDPKNERRFSEHFVVRRYRPSRSTSERQAIRQDARAYGSRRARHRDNLVSQYQLKLSSEGRQWDNAARQRFAYLYTRIEQLKRQERLLQAQGNETERDRLLAPRREYARTLEELGRRDPGSDAPVEQSPPGIVASLALVYSAQSGG